MGEAKRRRGRQAQEGKASEIPVTEFRAAEGMVALTLDVHGISPISVSVEASKLDDNLRSVGRGIDPSGKAHRDGNEYVKIRSLVIASLRQASAAGGDKLAMKGIGMAGLWCVFNHPTGSDAMRRQVSEALRRTGKAHITLACDARGIVASALADKFVEMNPLLAAADGSEGVLVVQRDSKPTPTH